MSFAEKSASADNESWKQNIPFWNVLCKEESSFLKRNLVIRTYTKGSNMHNYKEECMGVLFVRSGQLRVYMISEDGREVTLYRLFAGDTCTLSASCILQEITFEVRIDVTEDSEVLVVNAASFLELSRQNIYVENFLYKQTVEKFSDVMWAMQQILFMSFDRRLAIFLLEESNTAKADVIYMTHDQIAKYLGSAREVVTRMLKYFSEEGIVTLARGEIWIKNRKKLRKLAD